MKKIALVLILLFATASTVEARCTERGVVTGLNYYGDDFLAVRTGPGTKYRATDHIYNGDRVRICKWNRKWLYIRYTGGRYGWVYGKYIRIRY